MRKERKVLKVSALSQNNGQLPWLPKNPRQWTQTDIDRTANSINEDEDFLEDRPLLVVPDGKKYVVFAGNLRLTAAKKEGLTELPCVVYYPDTDEDHLTVKRRAMKDNGSFGSWDFDELANSWDDLPLVDFGIPAWETDAPIQENTPTPEDDEFNEDDNDIQERVHLGDIWLLGDHRVMCGDSTKAEDVDRLFNGEKARMLFTSPPYSDMREYNGEKDLSVSNLVNFIPVYAKHTDYQCINLGIQRKDADIVEYWNDYIAVARGCGYKFLAWNIWDKTMAGSIGNQSAFFPIRHEWIFVFGTEFYEINCTWEKDEKSIRTGFRTGMVRQADGKTRRSPKGDQSQPLKQMESVVQMLPTLEKEIRDMHPATFPVGLPSEYIKAMSNKGDIIAEPFGGSGTTIIAAEQLGRRCFAMELDEHYCDVILARWEKLTGKTAKKIS